MRQELRLVYRCLGNSALSLLVFSLALVALSPFHAAANETETPQVLMVGAIDISGLERYEREWFIGASGVAPGQEITLADLHSAAKHLLGTGLFERISDRYMIKDSTIDVTWLVEEVEWGLPVLLDNFIWFTEAQLWEAIARHVPSYDGTAPNTEGVVATISRVLQDLLATRSIKGTVEYLRSIDPELTYDRHVFTVRGVSMPICSVTFSGELAAAGQELAQRGVSLIGTDYTSHYVLGFTRQSLLPIYQRRGYLRARVGDPRVKAHSDDNCPDGVKVTLSVQEGSSYSLGHVEWAGNKALASGPLGSLMTLEEADVADLSKLQDDLERVRNAYWRIGHIQTNLTLEPHLDDARLAANYLVTVDEGPQYRMGSLTIAGLPDARHRQLLARWRLARGDVYDALYPKEFIDAARRSGIIRSSVHTKQVPDNDKRLVDVSITVSDK